jgi:hypothetical protein
MEGGSINRDFEEWMKGALEMERLSLKEFCEGNLEDVQRKALEWASVSIGTPLFGNIKGRSFPRAFERRETFLYLGKLL